MVKGAGTCSDRCWRYLGSKKVKQWRDDMKKEEVKTVSERRRVSVTCMAHKRPKNQVANDKKGVESYRAANPGSKLKTAVTTKPSKLKKGSKAANRRKSFCSRMKDKEEINLCKTARDPDSRINKSLRKWNC